MDDASDAGDASDDDGSPAGSPDTAASSDRKRPTQHNQIHAAIAGLSTPRGMGRG